MSEAILDIKNWGNNLGVRIPASVARKAHLHADQRVRVSVEDGKVIITPLENEMTLEKRLSCFDSVLHGGEFIKSSSIGNGIWKS